MEGCLAQVVERRTCWHLPIRPGLATVNYFKIKLATTFIIKLIYKFHIYTLIELMTEHKRTVYRIRLKAVCASNRDEKTPKTKI